MDLTSELPGDLVAYLDATGASGREEFTSAGPR